MRNNKIIFKTLMLKGEAGATIASMERTGHVGTTDIYTITFSDGTTAQIPLENMSAIISVEKTSQTDTQDIYTITCADGSTQTFSVLNHNADFANMEDHLDDQIAEMESDIAEQTARIDNFLATQTGTINGTKRTETVLFESATPSRGTVIDGNKRYLEIEDEIDNYDYIEIYYGAFDKYNLIKINPSDVPEFIVPLAEDPVIWAEDSVPESSSSSNYRAEFKMYKYPSEAKLHFAFSRWRFYTDINYYANDEQSLAESGIGIMKIVGIKYTTAETSKDPELADLRIGADGTVYNSAGEAMRGQVTALEGQIGAAGNNLAAEYDATQTYVIGDYCVKNGVLYVCTTVISTAEAWTAGHWTAVKVMSEMAAAVGDLDDEISSLNEDLSEEIDKIADVTVISEISPTTVTDPVIASFTEGYYIRADGTKVADENYHYTEKFPVKKGDVFSTPGVSIRFVTAYNGDTVVSASGESTIISSYTVPDGIDGIVLTLYSTATTINKTYYPVIVRNALDDVLEMSNITTFPSINRFDVLTITEDKVLASSGNGLTDSESYNTSDYIYVGDLDSIKIYRNQTPVSYNVYYVLFDANKNYLGSRAVGNNITIGNAVYIRFSYDKAQSYLQAVDGSKKVSWYSAYQTPTTARDSERFIELDTKCSQLFTSNVLYGKKWVACGDSFTEGAYNDVTNPEDRYIMEGRYMGENAVYPFMIGNRNDMVIVNEAVSGSTMCLNDGTHNAFSTANGRYTQIPNDADYITLYFGINDVNYNSPMGEITDDDNTTFYGAWNVVMDYLIEHHPFAKIGIIVTNGASQAIREAEIAIAKRWGIAFYDMNGLPLMHRSFNQDALTSVKNERNENFRVSASNLHPNKKAHEYQSTAIEAWLRSL